MKDKIIETLKSTLELQEVSYNISKENTPEWDSLKHLILVSNLESVFEVVIEPEDLIEMNSLDQIEFILTKIIKK
jgi:acyl carrier protein